MMNGIDNYSTVTLMVEFLFLLLLIHVNLLVCYSTLWTVSQVSAYAQMFREFANIPLFADAH